MRFLLIDHHLRDRARCMAMLRPAFPTATWIEVGHLTAYEAALATDTLTVVLTESRLPWVDGLTVLHDVRQRWPALPVLMVTSASQESLALAAMQRGLSDYVLKESLRRLPIAVQGALDKAHLVTELRHTSKRLQDAQGRYEALVEESQEVIYTHDVQGNFTWINRAAERLTGYTRQEAVGMNIAAVVVPEHLTLARTMMARKLAAADPDASTLYAVDILTKRGARLTLEVWTRLMSHPGQPLQIQGMARDITARKRAETLLQQSEARFSTIFHTSPNTIAVTRLADGVCLAINNRFPRAIGYAREEVLGKSTLGLNLWVDPAQRQHFIQRLREAGEVHNFEAALRTKHGKVITGLISASVIEMDGTPCILSVTQDSTALKQAEEERAAEARFLQVQTRIAQEALSSLQSEVVMPRLLAAVCRAQGFASGVLWRLVGPEQTAVAIAVYGQAAAQFLGHRQDARTPDPLLAQVIQTRQPAFRNRLHATPSALSPLLLALQGQACLAIPLVDRTNQVLGVLLGVDAQDPERFSERDLTQGAILAHQIAQSLENCELFSQVQRLQEQYRVVSETLYDGVFMVDSAGRIVFANPAFARLTGYAVDELLGTPSLQLYAPEVLPQVISRRERAWKGQYVSPYTQTHLLRKDGQRLAVEMSMANVTLEGRVLGRVAATRDLTERQRLETQLRQAQKMQAIGTLAGGIAHDFNNILAAIMGFAELTLDEVPQDSGARANLEHVLRAGERAKQLIDQLLTFSRQQEQERRPLHIALLVKEVLTWLRATLPTTITLRYSLDEQAGPVLADPIQVHQLLLNLCTNAEHAMRQTGGILEVRLEAMTLPDASLTAAPDLPPGSYARLTVRDTGCGMAPDVMERIFEPFFTTKGVGEGTGLGLAVVHGIVTSHGGAITIESALNQGTLLAVYLPHSPVAVAPSELTLPLATGHERILFVDDEPALARLGKALLTQLGYTVTAHTSSLQALKSFGADPEGYDLLITDQTMPDMTGEALVRAVRQIRPALPIILCTGFSHTMTEAKALDLGIDAFYLKPLTLPALSQLIRRVLTQRTQPAP